MDRPIRTKLLAGFIGIALLGGVLTMGAGSFLIDKMVIGEAQRRVQVGLKTAWAMLERSLTGAQTTSGVIADWAAMHQDLQQVGLSQGFLEKLREKCGYDLLQIVDTKGVVMATARGEARGMKVLNSPMVLAALKQGRAASGLRLVPLREIAAESPQLAARAHMEIVPTPRAKAGGPEEISEAMVMEAVSPILKPPGIVVGVVRVAVLLNGNFDFVDFVRDNVFTMATYNGKNLGTVTIFLHDVRIATNVLGPTGERAIGTRVSAEVYDKVLGQGQMWIGPAFVVNNWYVSAYEPIRDPEDKIIGILYVGVIKDRYDDMRRQALNLFLAITLVAVGIAGAIGTWSSKRLAGPVSKLTAGAAEIARGNLSYRLAEPLKAERDEIKKLTSTFNEMAKALQDREEEVRLSHEQLAGAAEELKRWNQNYLDTLEFITHELKNQVAAMKINLLAVRDGYVGDLSDDQKDAMDDVLVAVNRTEEMILNYLNLSRIEKGDLEVRTRLVQVEMDVVRPVLRELRARFDEKQMRVEVDLPEDLVVIADPSLLQIVFENLLSNAAKYGRREGLVRVWGRRLNGNVELHTWNEGQGVPPDQVDEMFRKFARLQRPGEQERGTGLGLFITREIVRKHEGDIRAESEYGKWIDFIFTLPRPDVLLEDRIG
jgi:two-component system NtrC family sensor kinase